MRSKKVSTSVIKKKERSKGGYQRHNGRWEARYRPQCRWKLTNDAVTMKAFKGFSNGLYKYEFLEYFDSQEEKDEWLYDTKKDFTRRKKQSNPESSPEIFTDSSMMEQSITELGHIVDDDDEYVPPGKDNRTCKTMAMMYSNESEYEDNCDSHHNSTGLSKLTKPEGFYLLSAQVMWKCSTCNHCQTPFDNTCSFCPPFSAITGSGKLPVSATLDLPHSVATKVQLTTESFPPPSFYESDIAETAVFPEKGEEFLDDLMGMMNENSEVHEPKEALQDVIKHRTRKVKIPDRLIMKV